MSTFSSSGCDVDSLFFFFRPCLRYPELPPGAALPNPAKTPGLITHLAVAATWLIPHSASIPNLWRFIAAVSAGVWRTLLKSAISSSANPICQLQLTTRFQPQSSVSGTPGNPTREECLLLLPSREKGGRGSSMALLLTAETLSPLLSPPFQQVRCSRNIQHKRI